MKLDEVKSKREMEQLIDSLKSENGGWSKASLAKLGVEWPPKKGWRKELIASPTQH